VQLRDRPRFRELAARGATAGPRHPDWGYGYTTIDEYFPEHPEEGANFDEAMGSFTSTIAVAVAAAYDFSFFRTIIDIGGGEGALDFLGSSWALLVPVAPFGRMPFRRSPN
jgi:O-methyltransferase domain